MDLLVALDRVFPFARGIEVSLPPTEDGSWMAELLLPVKRGESVVQVYRFPAAARPVLEEQLRWNAPHQRASVGYGRWAFFLAWDGTASEDEIWELIGRRVSRHPVLGDPGHDEDGRPTI